MKLITLFKFFSYFLILLILIDDKDFNRSWMLMLMDNDLLTRSIYGMGTLISSCESQNSQKSECAISETRLES